MFTIVSGRADETGAPAKDDLGSWEHWKHCFFRLGAHQKTIRLIRPIRPIMPIRQSRRDGRTCKGLTGELGVLRVLGVLFFAPGCAKKLSFAKPFLCPHSPSIPSILSIPRNPGRHGGMQIILMLKKQGAVAKPEILQQPL